MKANPGTELRAVIDCVFPVLNEMDEQSASQKPSPAKWSAKEIIGHLIDSASNNHQRFVRAVFTDDLIFSGYAQDKWVEQQKYNERAWPGLLHLWFAFNLHLAWVMENTDYDILSKPRQKHNLHQISWQIVPENEPTTLAYFMNDYIGHLKHHLTQILPDTL